MSRKLVSNSVLTRARQSTVTVLAHATYATLTLHFHRHRHRLKKQDRKRIKYLISTKLRFSRNTHGQDSLSM